MPFLPNTGCDTALCPARASAPFKRPRATAMSDRRLLICDDEPAFGRFVRTVAEGMGYRVLITGNGRAFIAAYEDFQPTTVILDMIMPEMDGNELVLWLAQRQSRARVIIITGFTPDYASNAKLLAEHEGARAGDDPQQAGAAGGPARHSRRRRTDRRKMTGAADRQSG